MKPNKEAMFGLSFSLAVTEALLRKEPAKHTRRAQKLQRVIDATLAALDCYPGQLDAKYLDLAAEVFNTLTDQAVGGLSDGMDKS